uniref:Mesoderm posterior aa n=1 Tax=Labrus bergylta TaxID=56723 RepID=A0A3Q3EDC4_9LABR
MDVSHCSALQLQDNSFLFDCESLLDKCYDPLAFDPAADPGYFSAGSSLSPTSSVDSFCFSPASLQSSSNEQDALDCFVFKSPVAPHLSNETQQSCSSKTASTTTAKKSRSRYPGKKRQTASEREKLRMRDLTKAMHHLRNYLPASVAPAGQTLTKIDTLRLTIRYISHLSAQLGLSEEALEQRASSGSVEHLLQCVFNQNLQTCETSTHSICASVNSLIEYMVPVGSDEVPRQRLTDGVCSDISDGESSILLTDLLWVQTILQIPATHSHSEDFADGGGWYRFN